MHDKSKVPEYHVKFYFKGSIDMPLKDEDVELFITLVYEMLKTLISIKWLRQLPRSVWRQVITRGNYCALEAIHHVIMREYYYKKLINHQGE